MWKNWWVVVYVQHPNCQLGDACLLPIQERVVILKKNPFSGRTISSCGVWVGRMISVQMFFFSFGKSPWKRFLFFHNVGMRLYLFTWFDSANIFLTISSPPPTHPLPPSPPPPTHSSPTFSPQLIYSPHSSPPLLLLIYSLSERIHVIKWLIFKDLRMLNGKQVSQNHRKWSLPRSCDQHNFSIESKICA